ncbi:MAG: di-heme oxidoredictase family protein [Pseudomonadota bacterium]|uniref:di-heme oxidoredictase family protein n=1 Tax=Gallaecimonas pentaromativorans TaxID=584787 RepID=UPI00067EF34C|nr:di-heme oxidoredictase family protein [Gallaecimonas pentaromativorans]MED5526273.1 di-heme oxidoredictase family protein [Pseudomonadota bacterium]
MELPLLTNDKTRFLLITRWVVMLPLLGTLLVGCGGGGDDGSTETTPTPPPVSGTPDPEEPGDTPVTPVPEDENQPTLEAPTLTSAVPLPKAGGPSLPPPPDSLRLPADFVFSSSQRQSAMSTAAAATDAAVVTPLQASSSGDENDTNTAAKAIDGDLQTRWESAWSNAADPDAAWLQFDFGSKTAIGYMKLQWERAHAAQYAVYISDDAQTWYQLRYVVGSQGETEQFYNLGIYARYLRLQGVTRATQYGYSLFEAEFRAPTAENSLPTLQTSAVSVPMSGAGLTPLPQFDEPIESTQFSLPDGRLVTRFGMVGRSRHARERGEDWNEIGYGVNDTVDAAGNPRDKGPGAHLNFVANYFQFRTWGVEIIDDSHVAGVTHPKLVVNQYFQEPQKGGGHVFVRGFDNPYVTGYGWMSPGDLLDDSTYLTDGAPCPVVAKPANGVLLRPDSGYGGVIGANDGCSVLFDTFPGHRDNSPDANGVMVPNGKTIDARPLEVGDVLEFSSSFFTTREIMDSLGDSHGYRYYTNELTYVMGEGLRPWYGVQPRLKNEPLPKETLQGGTGSISYDYADNAAFMFQQPQTTIAMENMQRFVEGRRWIHTNLWTGEHNEPDNDRNDAGMALQGPRFNQSSCFGCHINNGRSAAPTVINQRLDTMAVRTAESTVDGTYWPDRHYGLAVQMNARSVTTGEAQNWGTGVWLAGFEDSSATLADGTVVALRKPKVAFEGPTPAVYSLRAAQPMIGMGLLEAIPDAEILSRVRTSPDEDGVKGTANYGYDPETGEVHLGRYGWKAGKVSLRHQVTNAALLDMSVTSPVYPNRLCLAGSAHCNASDGLDTGLSAEAVERMTQYLQLLGVPAQRSLVSGFPKGVTPLPYLDVDPDAIAKGEKLFTDIRCSSCHVVELQTGNTSEFAEVRNQTIKPYTDMLLHDMGDGLADGFQEGLATGSMWRTSPLWGIGYTEYVAAGTPVGYLHDSRARSLTEAIMWHGGEAQTSKQRFAALSAQERQQLLSFLKSL